MTRVVSVLAAGLLSGNLAISQTPDQAETGGARQDFTDWPQLLLVEAMKKIDHEISVEFRKLVEQDLEVGASSETIEAFFEKYEIGYSYNRFANRYRGMVRDVENNSILTQNVVIHIYVDENKNFVRADVYDSFK